MHFKPATTKRPRGFSLVELLVVITVLGVIAGIALANMSGTDGASRTISAKAQAQRIASVFAAGQATGAPGFKNVDSVGAAINAVGNGSYGDGINKTSYFQVPGVSANMDADKPATQRASHYLRWETGALVYHPEGGSTYATYAEWSDARNQAMLEFLSSGQRSEAEVEAFLQQWIAQNPPPGNGGYYQ